MQPEDVFPDRKMVRPLSGRAYARLDDARQELHRGERLFAVQKRRVPPVLYSQPILVANEGTFRQLKGAVGTESVVTLHLFAVQSPSDATPGKQKGNGAVTNQPEEYGDLRSMNVWVCPVHKSRGFTWENDGTPCTLFKADKCNHRMSHRMTVDTFVNLPGAPKLR